jgi:hypothetical protein
LPPDAVWIEVIGLDPGGRKRLAVAVEIDIRLADSRGSDAIMRRCTRPSLTATASNRWPTSYSGRFDLEKMTTLPVPEVAPSMRSICLV